MIEYDPKERCVVWKLRPRDAALLAEWIEDQASPNDGLQDDAKALKDAALEGFVYR